MWQDEDRHAMRPNEVLRGRGFGTNQVVTQTLTLHRNGTLPPISSTPDIETSPAKVKYLHSH